MLPMSSWILSEMSLKAGVTTLVSTEHDGSLFKFVDDLLQFLVVTKDPVRARQLFIENRDALDAKLTPAGFKQSMAKRSYFSHSEESAPTSSITKSRMWAGSCPVSDILVPATL